MNAPIERHACRKTDRTAAPRHPVLTAEIIVSEFKKNRAGESVRVVLRGYEGQNILDIRTWFGSSDGIRRPGRGFACSVKLLPELATAVSKALAKAIELGLIEADGTQ